MRPCRPAPLVVALLAAALVVGPSAASSAQSLSDTRAALAEAREERTAVQSRLDEAAARLGEVEQRVAELEHERDRLAAEADALATDVDALQEGMQDQVAALFKRGSVHDPLTVFLTSEDPNEALLRAETMQRVVVADLGEVEALGADRRQLAAVRERLDEQRDEVADALAEQEEVRAELQQDLERAAELEEQLEADERRQREEQERREAEERERAAREAREAREAERERAAASSAGSGTGSGSSTSSRSGSGSSGGGSGSSGGGSGSSGGAACPVGQPHSFTDTWGAPRSGGRAHRGTDILAPYGIPVYAIVGGTWAIKSPGPSAGLWAILHGDDGSQYWYMHLQSHTVANGARVSAGQQVGTNGDTGNARGTPHVHFELHPGGGGATNPYPTLRSVC